MMSSYTSISIVYNPNSTNNAKKIATEFRADLVKALPHQRVLLNETKYAGHAEKIAYDLAKASAHPLIIGASGDGGYHELVNGVLKANREGAHAVTGLLPAGNANDHYRALHDDDMATLITRQQEKTIDVLKLVSTQAGAKLERYAHSYIGLGLTPRVGAKLNTTRLNIVKETMIALKVLFILRATHIKVGSDVKAYDSLVFTNISQMSKYFKVAKNAKPDDGKFEMAAFRRRNKFQLIHSLMRTSFIGLPGDKQLKRYTFKTIKPTLIQMDGEVIRLDGNASVKIVIEPRALQCII